MTRTIELGGILYQEKTGCVDVHVVGLNSREFRGHVVKDLAKERQAPEHIGFVDASYTTLPVNRSTTRC